MSAALLSEAGADGVLVTLSEAGKLKVAGPADAVHRWRERIAANKREIIEALSLPARVSLASLSTVASENPQSAPPRIAPDPDALAADFEERAAIIEEGDGVSRAEAERRAWRIVYGKLPMSEGRAYG